MIKSKFFLSSNTIKIFAAIFMLIDHTGMILFPRLGWMRSVGRLAFPLFAFFIVEGVRYTRSRVRYLAAMAVCGAMFALVQYIATDELYFNVLITFSFGIALSYLLDNTFMEGKAAGEAAAKGDGNGIGASFGLERALSFVLFLVLLFAIALFCSFAPVDYGIFGVSMIPLGYMGYLFAYKTGRAEKGRVPIMQLVLFSLGLALLCYSYGGRQWYAMLSLVFLLLYNGSRGFKLSKYFFYIFYPLHIVILQMIAWLI